MFAAGKTKGVVNAEANYIESCFSTYLYAGSNSTQTITNGIDLSGKGGLVWAKNRSSAGYDHVLTDTIRGAGNILSSNNTVASQSLSNTLTAFGSTGFTLGSDPYGIINYSGQTYASWTFRKQPKFFDVVTWTGDGVAGRQISHSLGSAPGAIIVKCTNTARDWAVWQNTLSNGTYLKLNTTDSVITNTSFQVFGDASGQTSTYFTVGKSGSGVNGLTNANGDTYVAYLFAHNAGGFGLTGTDNVISCGSFTTDGSGNASVTLGYESQLVITKASSSTSYWHMQDNMRGFTSAPTTYSSNPILQANSSSAEITTGAPTLQINSTGFTTDNGSYNASTTYIYIAIRRGPMKVPTDGTKVFAPVAYTGNGGTQNLTTGFAGDMAWIDQRNNSGQYVQSFDKLRGNNVVLYQNSTSAEQTNSPASYTVSFDNTQTVLVGPYSPNGIYNNSGSPQIAWNFRRAPSFFDEVCYTGDGTDNRQVTHNLGVAPEMVVVKPRGVAWQWWVYHTGLGNTRQGIVLNSTAAKVANADAFSTDGSAFTSSYFLQSASSAAYPPNANGYTYVAYLFATCAGVSKVTSFTGNGSTQTINCGFTSGARFVLIKATSTTGNWLVFDTARGMTTSTDPWLALNSTAAESSTTGACTTTSVGFTVDESKLTGVNTNGVSYIVLAVA